MSNATIGALRVVLGIDTASFEKGLTGAQKHLRGVSRQMQGIGQSMMLGGGAMTATITAPFIAMGFAAVRSGTEARNAVGQVEAALNSMGRASGKTLEGLKQQALDLRGISVFDDDDILTKVTANMLTFGRVSGEAFDRAQLAAVNLSARLGQDLQSSALMVGKALNNPIQGLAALNRVGIQFTDQQKAQIKAMVEAGDVAGAQAIMLRELETQFGGAAQAMRDADPWSANRDKWRDMEGTLERIALQVAPPLLAVLGDVMDIFNAMPSGMQASVIGAVAVGAAFGPVVTVMGGMVTAGAGVVGMMSKMKIAKEGAAGGAGLLARSMGVLRGAMMFLVTTPWGLLITGVALALGLLVMRSREATPAQKALDKATGDLAQATNAYEEAVAAAAVAQGEGKQAALETVNAMRVLQVEARQAALDEIKLARATLARARAQQAANRTAAANPENADWRVQTGLNRVNEDLAARQRAAQSIIDQGTAALDEAQSTIDRIDAGMNRTVSPGDLGTADDSSRATSADQARQEAEQRRRTVQDMAHTVALEEARLTNNQELVRQLEREDAVRQRTRALIDAGIMADAAAAAEAERVQQRLDAAMAVQFEREIDEGRRAWELELWRLDGREDMVRTLEREIQLEERINWWRSKGLDLVTATAAATSEMAELDLARAEAAERAARTAQREHDIEVARLRGDWRQERALSRDRELENRARDYMATGEMTEAEARRRAQADVLELDEAEFTGKVRRMVADGWQAAMDGNLSDFAKQWIQDWASRGLEDALNSLADVISSLFRNMNWGGGEKGGGGIGGLISGALSLFGGGMKVPGTTAIGTGMKIPGFKGGGSFRVAGQGGQDSQLMQFLATPGEMVDIRTPGQTTEPGPVVFDMRGAFVPERFMEQVEAKVAAGEARVRRDVPGVAVGAVADALDRGAI